MADDGDIELTKSDCSPVEWWGKTFPDKPVRGAVLGVWGPPVSWETVTTGVTNCKQTLDDVGIPGRGALREIPRGKSVSTLM